MNVAILGSGPHGRQLHDLIPGSHLFDDFLPGHAPTHAATDPYVLGAAFPAKRREIAARLNSEMTPYRRGVFVFPGVHIGQGVRIGDHTHVMYGAVISHGCQVGEFVTIAANVTLCGEVTVEDDVFIGAGATVIHGGIRIGRGATIGANALIIDNVPAGATMVGPHAQMLKPAWSER